MGTSAMMNECEKQAPLKVVLCTYLQGEGNWRSVGGAEVEVLGLELMSVSRVTVAWASSSLFT